MGLLGHQNPRCAELAAFRQVERYQEETGIVFLDGIRFFKQYVEGDGLFNEFDAQLLLQ